MNPNPFRNSDNILFILKKVGGEGVHPPNEKPTPNPQIAGNL